MKKPKTQLDNFSISDDINYFESYSNADVHAMLLMDKRRTLTYQLAITRAGRRLKEENVIDVGSGCGILSIFCAKVGVKHVFAVEAANKMQELSQDLIQENGLSNTISVFSGRAEEVDIGASRVGAVVSEWMGHCLLYENMLPSVLSVRDSYLRPDTALPPTQLAAWRRKRMFPCSASLSIAAITETSADSHLEPPSTAVWTELSQLYQVTLNGSFPKLLMTEYLHKIHIQPVDPKCIVSEGATLCCLDLASLDRLEFSNNGVNGIFELKCFGSVEVTGFVIWFSVEFPDGDILNTSPYEPLTHWQQSVLLLQKPVSVTQNIVIDGTVNFSNPQTNTRDLTVSIACCFKNSKTGETLKTIENIYYLNS